jgi:hypothetical protein
MTLLNTIRNAYDIEDGVEDRLGLRPYSVYLRTATYEGSDISKGIKGTATLKDTIIIPKPKAEGVSFQLVRASGGYVQQGDMMFYISAKNYTDTQIWNSVISMSEGVSKDKTIYRVISIDGYPTDSTPLQWKVLGRKMEGNEPPK